MKTTCKILSIVLVLTMVAAMFAVSASAAEAIEVPLLDDITSFVQGMPASATNVQYLSDATPVGTVGGVEPAYTNDVPWALPDKIYAIAYINPDISSRKGITKDHAEDNGTPGSRYLSVEKKVDVLCYHTDIRLGGYGWKYDKGLGVHPAKEGESAVIYATNGANTFYAVVGNTGMHSSDPKNKDQWKTALTYELWGSTAAEYSESMEYTKLAYAKDVDDWDTAEFNIDITGYNYIKLVVNQTIGTFNENYYAAGMWANACVYTADPTATTEAPTEEATEAPTEEETEATTAKPTVAPTEAPSTDSGEDSDSPAGLIIGIVIAVVVIAGVVVIIISKKKKAA